MDERRMRQTDLVSEDILSVPIVIVGAGGIGSLTTLAFAKVGFHDLHVWDFDKVETHNLANQFYRLRDVGQYKCDALKSIIEEFEGIKIENYCIRFDAHSHIPQNAIVVMAVDSMSARKEIYEYVAMKSTSMPRLIIDGRMGGNQLEVYTCNLFDRADRRMYNNSLCTDAEAADIPCTQKAVMYNVLSIASWIVNQARLVLSNKPYMRMLTLDLENMILLSQGEALQEQRVNV